MTYLKETHQVYGKRLTSHSTILFLRKKNSDKIAPKKKRQREAVELSFEIVYKVLVEKQLLFTQLVFFYISLCERVRCSL